VDEADGLAHPTAMDQYLVEWKRPELLLEDTPVVPVVVLRPPPAEGEGEDGEPQAAAPEGDDAGGVRDLVDEHCLYFGTPCVEWIANAIRLVYERRDVIEPGYLLWENIWPKDPETNLPIPSPNGKYLVRAYVMNAWRVVEVDDRLPVDLFGATLGAGLETHHVMAWFAHESHLQAHEAVRRRAPRDDGGRARRAMAHRVGPRGARDGGDCRQRRFVRPVVRRA
jgi:hypothetical protein